MTEPLTMRLLEDLNPAAISLYDHYEAGVDRSRSYEQMQETILGEVRAGRRVCAAFYGHPGIFVAPSHGAVRQARKEGFPAWMLPGVSAEDCLFADLGVDPGVTGCQSFETTDFLLRRRQVDPSAALVLWQVSVLGIQHYEPEPAPRNLDVLVEYLLQWYAPTHRATLYEASAYPLVEASIRELALADLPCARPSPLATLYLPPSETRAEDAEMAARLGIEL